MTADRPEVSSSRSSRRVKYQTHSVCTRIPLFPGAQTISSPFFHEKSEGGGMLPIHAVRSRRIHQCISLFEAGVASIKQVVTGSNPTVSIARLRHVSYVSCNFHFAL